MILSGFFLYYRRIRLNLKSNLFLLGLLGVGICCCTLAMIVLYGNTMPHMTNQTPEKNYRSLDVLFYEPISMTDFDLIDMAGIEYEDIIYKAVNEQLNVKASLNNHIYEDFWCDASFGLDPNEHTKQIILSQQLAEFKQIKQYTFLGNTYDVVGYAYDTYIPYAEFLGLNLSVQGIRIVFKQVLSAEQNHMITTQLQSSFYNCSIKDPQIYVQQDVELSIMSVVLVSLLCLILFLSLIYILNEILYSEIYVNNILKLQGASSRFVFILTLVEHLTWFVAFGGLSCFIHDHLYTQVFESFNMYSNVSYDVVDYIFILFIINILALCCMTPLILHVVRKNDGYCVKRKGAEN